MSCFVIILLFLSLSSFLKGSGMDALFFVSFSIICVRFGFFLVSYGHLDSICTIAVVI